MNCQHKNIRNRTINIIVAVAATSGQWHECLWLNSRQIVCDTVCEDKVFKKDNKTYQVWQQGEMTYKEITDLVKLCLSRAQSIQFSQIITGVVLDGSSAGSILFVKTSHSVPNHHIHSDWLSSHLNQTFIKIVTMNIIKCWLNVSFYNFNLF